MKAAGDQSIEDLMSDINLQLEFRQQAGKLRTHNKPESMHGARSVRSLKSFRSQRTSIGALSNAGSVADSAISHVPELDPIILMSMGWEVYQLRNQLIPKA